MVYIFRYVEQISLLTLGMNIWFDSNLYRKDSFRDGRSHPFAVTISKVSETIPTAEEI